MCDFLDSTSINNLNKINGNIIKRRITKEIINLKETISSSICVYFDEIKKLPSVNVIIEENSKINNILFEFNSNYPFIPPIVSVNSEKYIEHILINNNLDFIKVLKELTGSQCLCCNSYVCHNNWIAGVKLSDLVLEIIQNQKHKEDVQNRLKFDKLNDDDKNNIIRNNIK
jgi:ubiquitin-protein ligase